MRGSGGQRLDHDHGMGIGKVVGDGQVDADGVAWGHHRVELHPGAAGEHRAVGRGAGQGQCLFGKFQAFMPRQCNDPVRCRQIEQKRIVAEHRQAALAKACAVQLATVNRAWTLFATHYFELTELAEDDADE